MHVGSHISYDVGCECCSTTSSLQRRCGILGGTCLHHCNHDPALHFRGLDHAVISLHLLCLIARFLTTGGRISCSGHLSAFTRMVEAISTYNKTLKPAFEQLVADANTFRMLNRGQRVLYHVFHV